MAESRKPGPLAAPPGSCSIPSRTPGSLGKNDQADPDLTTLMGNTPGPVGVCDWADPTPPDYSVADPYTELVGRALYDYSLAVGFDRKGATTKATKIKSGIYWVTWADANANASDSADDLAEPFRSNVKDFIKALHIAGATVDVGETKRSEKRAYLFHWCWLIGLGKKQASEAPQMVGVEIEWDHGDRETSKKGAKEMIDGFGLAVPPHSTNAPALNSNHIAGKAIDMNVTWKNTIKIKSKNGTEESVTFMSDVNKNTKLHAVGASYGVKKLKTDAPHWSIDGR